MASITFSIIIPVYNSEKTIRATLNSVNDQTFRNFEVIIVNDGSSDASLEIIKSFVDQTSVTNFHIISIPNRGVSFARNIGIKKAIGEWIAFLDSDDVWHKRKLEIMRTVLNEKFSLIGHESTLEEFSNDYQTPLHDIPLETHSFWRVLLKNDFKTPGVIVKNNLNLLFKEHMKYAEDHELWSRLSVNQPALLVKLPLVKLNRPVLSKGGISGNKTMMRYGEIKMYFEALKYKKVIFILLPFLITYSILKHLSKAFR